MEALDKYYDLGCGSKFADVGESITYLIKPVEMTECLAGKVQQLQKL